MFSLAAVSYLNSLPLYRTLEPLPDFHITRAVPAKLEAQIMAGECDAALLPIVDYLRHPDWKIVSDACIGCTGPVRSVLMFSRRTPDKIRSIAADTSSHTSVALTKVLCRDLWQVQPPLVDHAPQLETMLARHDAALIIGDNALEGALLCPSDVRIYDLGEEWQRLTGLPFVFAAWVGAKESPELGQILSQARDEGLQNLPRIIAENPIRTRLSPAQIEDYLRNVIEFTLDEAHRSGLEEFRARCQKHGLI